MLPANSGALEGVANVRFGSKADIGARPRHVRFTPKSGHCIAPQRMSALCQKRTWQLLRLYVDLLLNNNRKCEHKCGALAGL